VMVIAVCRMAVNGSLKQVLSSLPTAACVALMNSTVYVSMTGQVFTRQWNSKQSVLPRQGLSASSTLAVLYWQLLILKASMMLTR